MIVETMRIVEACKAKISKRFRMCFCGRMRDHMFSTGCVALEYILVHESLNLRQLHRINRIDEMISE